MLCSSLFPHYIYKQKCTSGMKCGSTWEIVRLMTEVFRGRENKVNLEKMYWRKEEINWKVTLGLGQKRETGIWERRVLRRRKHSHLTERKEALEDVRSRWFWKDTVCGWLKEKDKRLVASLGGKKPIWKLLQNQTSSQSQIKSKEVKDWKRNSLYCFVVFYFFFFKS